MNSATSRSTKTPRLHHRRLIRIYFFPWVLLVCAILLVALSLHIGADLLVISLIWGILVVTFLLKDLSSPYSLLTRYSYKLMEKTGLYTINKNNLEDKTVVYIHYNYPPLFPHRGFIRWALYLVILFVLGIYAMYQSYNPQETSAINRGLIVFLILLFTLLILIRFVSLPVDLAQAYRAVVWTVVLIWIPLTAAVSLHNLGLTFVVVFNAAILIFFVFLSVFVSQRLWADVFLLKTALDELTRDLLVWPQARDDLNGAAARIGQELRLDRVFILLPDEEHSRLIIHDQYGALQSVHGQNIPLAGSICGRAFRDKTAVLWNEVDTCPYFFALTTDDTKAEIAIPIMHRDIVYGILDVQSVKAGIFGPTDLEALQTISQTLGTALAASRSDTFFDEAVSLWRQTDKATNQLLASEEQVFNLFAEFAQEILQADLIVYYPLSLAGCPTNEPFTYGQFLHPEQLTPPRNDPASLLVCLVKQWQARFYAEADKNASKKTLADSRAPGFISRENIKSSCFIPIGMQSERLGALFLNFRQPRQFDTDFKFTCLSLAQSLAKVTAQIRYRNILFNSFGRPEINLHNILGRCGLKEGIMPRAEAAWQACDRPACQSLTDCPAYPMLNDLDDFLTEIGLAESSIPPDFWQENLTSKIRDYLSSLPHQKNGRRPQIDLQIDPRLERETPWVKLAFYRLITEAVNNAVLHGNATQIHIDAARRKDTLSVTIKNNGAPLPDNAQNAASSNGIFHLLNEFRALFAADKTEIRLNENNQGAIVTVTLPALPQVTLFC